MGKNILKGTAVIICTFAVFLVAKKIFAGVGGMPRVFVEAYRPAVFAEKGIVPTAAAILMSVIMAHLLVNFIRVRKSIHCAAVMRGTLYGFMYGMLWFAGFLEMHFVNESSFSRHALSGLRDIVALSAFGSLTGLLFFSRERLKSAGESLLVIVPVSVCFAVFHQTQYFVAFPEVNQHVHDAGGIVWLFATGALIGFMYYLFRPSAEGTHRRVLFFSVNMFGVNWLMYNSFYRLFVDIPLSGIVIRTGFDVTGVIAGLYLYEAMRKAERAFFGI